MKVNYQDHKSRSFKVLELINYYKIEGNTKDRKYMNEQIIKHLEFLKSKNIEKVLDFIPIFLGFGIKTVFQQKMIEGFITFMKITNNVDIFLMKKREMKKANSGERNILINILAIKYPEELISFIKLYIPQNYPIINLTGKIIEKFRGKTNQLTRPVLIDSLNNKEPDQSFGIFDEPDQSFGIFDEPDQSFNIFDEHDQSEVFANDIVDQFFTEF